MALVALDLLQGPHYSCKINHQLTITPHGARTGGGVRNKNYIDTVMSGEAGSDLEVVEISSYVRSYHVYMDIWNAEVGQELVLKCEPEHSEDSHAVAVLNEDVIVGHVPYNLAPTIERFLRREFNASFVQITGSKVNRGAGYGLEVPCIYRLYGPKIYCKKLK